MKDGLREKNIYADVKCRCGSKLLIRRDKRGPYFACERFPKCNDRYSVEQVYKTEKEEREKAPKVNGCTVTDKFMEGTFYLLIVDNNVSMFYDENVMLGVARDIVDEEDKRVYICDAIVSKVVHRVSRIAVDDVSTKENLKEYIDPKDDFQVKKKEHISNQQDLVEKPQTTEYIPTKEQYKKTLEKIKKYRKEGKNYKEISTLLNSMKARTKTGMRWTYSRVSNSVNRHKL